MNPAPAATRRAAWSLLAGNFAIGCGVLAGAGSLNDIARDLRVSVAAAGQLVTAGAVVMGVGAPLLAMAAGGWDRRRLLAAALVWFAAGHACAACAGDLGELIGWRAATVLAAAVFTPQAAAAIGVMSAEAGRSRSIAFVFLGWSLASVLGMPAAAYIAETLGWRWAFGGFALLALVAAVWVWLALPDAVRPPAMDLRRWALTLGHPQLMGLVAVTALSGAGQFTLLTYLAPYFRQVLGATPGEASALFFWFGLWGVIGSLALTQWIQKSGAAAAATGCLMLMAISLALWPLAATVLAMALVLTPWGAGCFSANSAQQARLAGAAPAAASATMALNTSAIYVGQGLGAAGGGAMAAAAGLSALWPLALAWMGLALMLSATLARRMEAASP